MRKRILSPITQIIRITRVHRLILLIQDYILYWLCDHWKTSNLIVLGPQKAQRLAIFSIFQPHGLSSFINLQLNYLLKLGCDIAIAIPHALSKSDQDYLDARCRFRVMRQNTGRDFGSYKDAILHIGFDRISEYQRVLFINDSIFFPVGHTETFEQKFLSSSADVIGLCENSAYLRHIASFFIDIDTRIFCKPKIQAFWKKYRNCRSRAYAIKQGECGFSQILYQAANSIDILYSSEIILKNTLSFLNSENFKFDLFFHLLSDVHFHSFKKYFLSMPQMNMDRIQLMFTDELRKILESSNHTHSFGLQLMTLFSAPFLKRDLYYREIFDLSQLQIALESYPSPLTEKIILEYRKRGALSNQKPWIMLMILLGIR